MKGLCLSFCLLGCTLGAVESTLYPSAGVESRWLSIPTSTRLAALSDAFVARGAEPGGVEVNPASLAGMEGWQALLTHNAWIEGMSLDRLGVAWHLGCLGTVGANFDYLSLGEVTRVNIDASGNPYENGTLHPNSMALGLNWAVDLGHLAAGITLRGLAEHVVSGQAGGADADLGLRYSFDTGWRAGLALQNMDLNITSGELRPFRARLGGGYTWRQERPLALDLNLDWQPNDGEPPVYRFGGEWAPYKQWIVRVGYIAGNEHAPRGPTTGLGWIFGQWEVDYALYGAGELGYSNLITLRYLAFGQ